MGNSCCCPPRRDSTDGEIDDATNFSVRFEEELQAPLLPRGSAYADMLFHESVIEQALRKAELSGELDHFSNGRQHSGSAAAQRRWTPTP
jgi:hypothetical protein